ncbi:MAG: cytochrome c [Candidatus Eisenbacteria bacterium]|uniref:Cytochrome c n=1 Tax=Eiseniibacteriota bacterium TaxID=2212470 RepID=A0A956NCB1_UNCEI|nr:cytochrome c [Candidatus Eisenbacteria bacterium]
MGTPSRLVSGDPGHGAQLFQELDCVRCHVEPRTGTGVNIPAALRDAGSRSRAEWIEAYLLEPRPLRYVSEDRRPERIMPALVTRPEDARDLAALLSTWRDTVRVPETSNRLGPAKNEDRRQEGRMLFEQYQCLGCHEFGGDGGHVGPALDGVGSRRRPAFVLAMLEHPDRVVPGTAMEDKKLWDSEAEAITTYLMNLQSKR